MHKSPNGVIMNTEELKINLINQITHLEDKARLEEIMQLIQFQAEEGIFATTVEDKKTIQEARNQIANGDFSTDDEIRKEIRQWLRK